MQFFTSFSILLAALGVASASPVVRSAGSIAARSNEWQTANITYFNVKPAPLACGGVYPDNALVVGVSPDLFDDGITCGLRLEIVAPNGHVVVAENADNTAEDGSLNVSNSVFTHLYPTAKKYADVYFRRTTKNVGYYKSIEPFYDNGQPPVIPYDNDNSTATLSS